jgi:glycosyltransferase involved in cell wall biosynthesis
MDVGEVKLSIILPVFNVEEYLERCIRSLEDQDLPRDLYEIIVVNDGSPDSSREVVIGLMKEFSNIILIDQENKGVSMARNAGIDRARGTYLLFVDPDDYVGSKVFGTALQIAISNNAEIVFLGYTFLDAQNHILTEQLYLEYQGQLYTGIRAYQLSRGNGKVDPDRSWAILFLKKFIKKQGLRYLSGIPYLEDGEFLARVLCQAKYCAFSDTRFYLRTTRLGSATNSRLFTDSLKQHFIYETFNVD